MKLLFIDSSNFLSLNERICFEKEGGSPQKRTIIVGPNNVGKTNVVRALKFMREVCEHTFNKEQAVSFVNRYSDKREFELEIGFCFDKEEIKDLNSFIKIYTESILKKINISNTDIEKIKKATSLNEEDSKKLLKDILLELLQSIFTEKFSSVSIIARCVEDRYPFVHFEFDVNGIKIKLDNRNCICKIDTLESASSKDFKKWLMEFLEEHNKVEVKSLLNFILEKGCLSLGDIHIHEVDDENRGKFEALLYKYNYPLDHNIVINLYHFLLHIFASHIILLDEVRARPVKQIDDEQFKAEIESPSPFYYGTGENLALFLYKLKNSQERVEREIYQEIKNLFKDFTELEFDISYTFNSKEKSPASHKLEIWIMDDKTQISIDYAGSGLLESLNIFSVVVGNRNCIIVLDEPALHLHPSKQRELMRLVNKISEESNNQFIIITHSPYLIEAGSLENVVRFNLKENETKIYPLVNILKGKGKEKIKKEFTINSHYKNILFAKGVIIVEGESEEIGVPFLLQRAGLSLEEYDIELLNVHADTNFETPTKIANMLKIPHVIVCDKKAFSKLSTELQSNAFHFEKDDFVDFLETEFAGACKRITNLNTINSKPQKTMMILQELRNEEIKRSSKIRKLVNFIKRKMEIKDE